MIALLAVPAEAAGPVEVDAVRVYVESPTSGAVVRGRTDVAALRQQGASEQGTGPRPERAQS